MPRKHIATGRPTGRPYIAEYDSLAKPCVQCGKLFALRDQPFQSRARFERRQFCSQSCANEARIGPNGGQDRFWGKVDREDGGCWNWQGSVLPTGYGYISHRNRKVRAHRFAYEATHGPIPDGKMILHSCDNRRCVNPSHLRPGTAKENMADAIARGRMKRRSGT